MNFKGFSLIIFTFICLFFSCKNNSKSFTANIVTPQAAPFISIKDSSVILKLHPANGASVYYTITTESDISEEINGDENESESKFDLGVLCSINRDADSNYLFSLLYDKFKVHTKTKDGEQDEDASTADTSTDPTTKLFAVFKDATIVGTVSPTGNVIALSGLKELNNKLYAIAKTTYSSDAVINTFSKGFITNDFFKSNIEQSFKAYPARPLKIGDTWDAADTVNAEVKLPVKTTYTLESVNDSTATIAVSSDIDIEDQPISIKGYNVTASIHATQEGEFSVDIASGLVLSGENLLKLKGNIDVLSKDVPIKFRIETSVTGVKR